MLKWFTKKEQEPVYTQAEVNKLLKMQFNELIDIFETKLECLPKITTHEEIKDLINQRLAIVDPAPVESIFSRCMEMIDYKLSDIAHDFKNQFDKRIENLETPLIIEISNMVQSLNNLRISDIQIKDKTLSAGQSTECTIVLNLPAPKYGCDVVISCDCSDVIMPKSIHFAHGTNNNSFEIKSFSVLEKITAHFTATINGHMAKFSVAILPPVKSDE